MRPCFGYNCDGNVKSERKIIELVQYRRAVEHQDAGAIWAYFAENASVYWQNTNEHFTAEKFICASVSAWWLEKQLEAPSGRHMFSIRKFFVAKNDIKCYYKYGKTTMKKRM